MEAVEKILTLKPCAEWSPQAAGWLARAVDTLLDLEDLRAQFKNGAALFEIQSEGECIGAFLLRVEDSVHGSVGVVVAASGDLRGVSLLSTVLPEIEKLFLGCKYLRVHSSRAGMASRLLKHGYKPLEVVYGKTLHA